MRNTKVKILNSNSKKMIVVTEYDDKGKVVEITKLQSYLLIGEDMKKKGISLFAGKSTTYQALLAAMFVDIKEMFKLNDTQFHHFIHTVVDKAIICENLEIEEKLKEVKASLETQEYPDSESQLEKD